MYSHNGGTRSPACEPNYLRKTPDIMFFLSLQDVQKCIAIMEELEALPVNQIILKKNPDIMNTIKKVLVFSCYSYWALLNKEMILCHVNDKGAGQLCLTIG